MKKLLVTSALVVVSGFSASCSSTGSKRDFRADPASRSPFIDELKAEIAEKDAEKASDGKPVASEGYTSKLKQKIAEEDSKKPADPDTGHSYSAQLKKEIEEKDREDAQDSKDKLATANGYTAREQAKLGPGDTDSAIQAVREGRSELHEKRTGEIHHAGGIRVGASFNREIAAASDVAGASFASVYGDQNRFAADVNLFYEYQPWHSEWFGSLGFFGSVGVGVFNGSGQFAVQLSKPNGDSYGATSRVKTQLFTVPMVAGLSYRFNLLRYLRPFVMVGPSFVGFYEQRNDDKDSHTASSRAFYAAGGVSILLDWMSRGSSWDLYAEHSIKHYYLTVEYDRLASFSGTVDMTVSGFFGGLTFEF